MTNLKSANIGFNKFCGPAVLSILTGKTTDECAAVISKVTNNYTVTGVQLNHLLIAADRLGFNNKAIGSQGTLYRTLVTIANNDGLYIITVPNHFVVIEVKDKQIYFCDNHTKEPINASASARLMQAVIACHLVSKRENYVEPELPKLLHEYVEIVSLPTPYIKEEAKNIVITRHKEYNYKELNTSREIASFTVTSKELAEITNRLREINSQETKNEQGQYSSGHESVRYVQIV